MPIELRADAVRLFAEVGFLGLGRGLPKEAGIIFDMLSALRPGEEAGAIGLALSALAENHPDQAIKTLKRGAQTPAVMAFSALAHGRLGEVAAARTLIEDLEAMGADSALVDMARGALDKS